MGSTVSEAVLADGNDKSHFLVVGGDPVRQINRIMWEEVVTMAAQNRDIVQIRTSHSFPISCRLIKIGVPVPITGREFPSGTRDVGKFQPRRKLKEELYAYLTFYSFVALHAGKIRQLGVSLDQWGQWDVLSTSGVLPTGWRCKWKVCHFHRKFLLEQILVHFSWHDLYTQVCERVRCMLCV